MSSSLWEKAANGAMVVLATALTIVLVQRGVQPSRDVSILSAAPAAEELLMSRPALSESAGSAEVTVVVFADFQCTFCREFAARLKNGRRLAKVPFRLVFKHFPLEEIHHQALAAAIAAECAGEQRRFWEYHDALLESQQLLPTQDWVGFAKQVGVDNLLQFEECLRSPRAQSLVERDRLDGDALGVRGTPTVFVNGRRFGRVPTTEEFVAGIEKVARADRRSRG